MYNYFKNICQEFRWKNINETRNYFLDEKEQKHKKVGTTLKYIEHFLIKASASTGCISIPVFASLLDVPKRIMSSEIGIKICAIAAKTKKYKLIIKKKKKKHDNMVFLAKSKLNSIEFLIFKTLCDSFISHDEFVLISNVLKEWDKIKEETKTLMT